MTNQFPKRLIEVDLPIKKISAHARREKSIRHGHISTLHIWWARRPLAACRAVLCAALWPDPADPLCPQKFRDDACRLINNFSAKAASDKVLSQGCSHDTWKKWQTLTKTEGGLDSKKEAHWNVLRFALLDFIADFADWDNSTVPEYLETSRALTQSAHEALGGVPGTRPLVVDPFAGGGSIPLEALRVGADAFASDLNPVSVLINKVVLNYIPKYGQRLADETRKWGEWIKREAEEELAQFYPKDSDGATPIAYLWARTIQCEGPSCGATVPLIRSLWLAKKANRSVALQLVPNPRAKRVDFQIIVKQHDGWVDQANANAKVEAPQFDGTVRRGSATCPCCGYTTPVARVREQFKTRRGGSSDPQPMSVLTLSADGENRVFRAPTSADAETLARAKAEIERREREHTGPLSLVPDEVISLNEIRRISVPIYGMMRWGDLFSPRQKLAFATLTRLVSQVGEKVSTNCPDSEFAKAVQASLGCVLSKVLDRNTALARWEPNVQCSQQVFGRQAIAMVWDFGEPAIFVDCAGSWPSLLDVWLHGLANIIGAFTSISERSSAHIETASAAAHPLPDDSADALVTDPPYYDAVPYSHLSDFFYVWQRRHLLRFFPELFTAPLVAKDEEIVVDRPHELSTSKHDIAFYERQLTRAFSEGRRILRPDGIGTIVFASKTTASWEAILKAIVDAGWIITGSWPIDTEMETRMNAMGTATLASSVHIVVRPRENTDGSVRTDEIGDWRDVLQELPRRIHDWMPRLAQEGVVGADAIFSCLGPALEIFSRHSRVEKPNGDQVTLKEYLEYVWAAVSKEAISMIFAGADTTGFEEDARLTAMWLWTLSPRMSNGESAKTDETEDADGDSDEKPGQAGKLTGFALEYDAARKIAQGLGAHLELLANLVEVKGDTARLLPVAERTKALFGKEGTESPATKLKKSAQLSLPGLLEELEQEDSGWTLQNAAKPGSTTLDRLHQAMILFAAGRGEGLRRFLVDDGVGKDQKFWSLAQSLCALYPSGTDERRWSEGVLARKKGLGL
jgi:adenine-specific DNA methylase